MKNPTGRINLWRRKFREILWKIELQVLLRLWGYTCEELSLCTRHFNISSREMFLTEVGTIQESLSNLLVWRFHRLMGVQPLWITNWTMVLQGERKVIPSLYHHSFCAGGRIHPSKGKQHICRQEDLQKKQLSSSLKVLERCPGASLGFILFLAMAAFLLYHFMLLSTQRRFVSMSEASYKVLVPEAMKTWICISHWQIRV